MESKENIKGAENAKPLIEQAGFVVGVLSLYDNKALAKYILENDTGNCQKILKDKIDKLTDVNQKGSR